MSRSKKSRSLKSVVSLKTGSKSKILDEEGNRGRIPSKNKLSKHKKKPKSAYAKAMSEKSKSKESEPIKILVSKVSNNSNESTVSLLGKEVCKSLAIIGE